MALRSGRAGWMAGMALALWAGYALAADTSQPHYPLAPFRVDALKPQRPAPDFALVNNAGGTTQLFALRPRVVVINFWATWCIPCVAELPELKRLADAFQGQPFALLAVDVEESPARVQAFLLKMGIDLPVVFDEEGKVHRDYAVRGLPTTVVVDGAGNVIAQALGSRQWHSKESVAYFRKLVDAAPRLQTGQ